MTTLLDKLVADLPAELAHVGAFAAVLFPKSTYARGRLRDGPLFWCQMRGVTPEQRKEICKQYWDRASKIPDNRDLVLHPSSPATMGESSWWSMLVGSGLMYREGCVFAVRISARTYEDVAESIGNFTST